MRGERAERVGVETFSLGERPLFLGSNLLRSRPRIDEASRDLMRPDRNAELERQRVAVEISAPPVYPEVLQFETPAREKRVALELVGQ